MQKDKDLHKLFRARLPIAVLPKEFADRLTKAVLDEVAQLHQATPLAINQAAHQAIDQETLNSPSVTKNQPPFKHTTAILLFFLLLNLQLWPLLQGCSFAPNRALSIELTVNVQSRESAPLKVSSNLPLAAKEKHLPPLGPVKPELPMMRWRPAPVTPMPMVSTTQTPNTLADSPINQQGLPGVEQQPAIITAVTVPREQPSSAQPTGSDPSVQPTPVATENDQSKATATTEAPDSALTLTVTPVMQPQLPTLNIFEPTLTPVPEQQNPGATATAEPTATPTLFIRPWSTATVPEITASPIS